MSDLQVQVAASARPVRCKSLQLPDLWGAGRCRFTTCEVQVAAGAWPRCRSLQLPDLWGADRCMCLTCELQVAAGAWPSRCRSLLKLMPAAWSGWRNSHSNSGILRNTCTAAGGNISEHLHSLQPKKSMMPSHDTIEVKCKQGATT